MSLQLIGKDILVEACSPCQKVWFETEEINKFQTYTQLRNQGKTLTFESNNTLIPFSQHLFNNSLDSNLMVLPQLRVIRRVAFYEATTNYVGNKITDTAFFKKHPVLTFFLVVVIVVLICKI